MNILFENPDKVSGQLTVTVDETDFGESVEKKLKEYKKSVTLPGFRPGMVPMALIKKRYGAMVKYDMVNKTVSEALYKYIKDNKLQMLGDPIPSEKQVAVDIEQPSPYTFVFDIAVAPQFEITLGKEDTLPYYEITLSEDLIDEQVKMYASRHGEYVEAAVYDPEKNDLMKGKLVELDGGTPKEGGIVVEEASLMPQYIKVEEQKNLFLGTKPGDTVVFNPKKAYPDNDFEITSTLHIDKAAAATMESDFAFIVKTISRYEAIAVGQKLFDAVYGEGTIKSEEEFRAKIASEIEPELRENSEYKFLADVRKYAGDKVGTLTYPDAILKRIMQQNNKDKAPDYVEKNYEGTLRVLTWHLIKEKLMAATGVKVDKDDVLAAAKDAARTEFMRYGMGDVPDEYLTTYAERMVEKKEKVQEFVDSAIDRKLMSALKDIVTLDVKKVTMNEFKDMVK